MKNGFLSDQGNDVIRHPAVLSKKIRQAVCKEMRDMHNALPGNGAQLTGKAPTLPLQDNQAAKACLLAKQVK